MTDVLLFRSVFCCVRPNNPRPLNNIRVSRMLASVFHCTLPLVHLFSVSTGLQRFDETVGSCSDDCGRGECAEALGLVLQLPGRMRRRLGGTLERVLRELNGEIWITLDEAAAKTHKTRPSFVRCEKFEPRQP